jgi:hypothetical protein
VEYEPWQAAEADAHDAKAESLTMAAAQLASVIEAVDKSAQPTLASALHVLEIEADRCRKRAKLLVA